MRPNFVIIMIACWCKILFFVSACMSSVVRVQFTLNDNIRLRFNMINVGQATAYKIIELNRDSWIYSTASHGNIRDTHVEYNSNRALTNTVSIYIYLYRSETKCNQRSVAELVLHEKYRDAETNDSCLSYEGCQITVDWNNNCSESNSIVEAKTKSAERTEKSFFDYSLIIGSLQGYNTKIRKRYIEGDHVTITCIKKSKSEPSYIKWMQTRDTDKIMNIKTKENDSSLIQMTISRFDNGTMIQCFLYKSGPNENDRIVDSSDTIEIIVDGYDESTTLYDVINANSKNKVPFNGFANLPCKEIPHKTWLKLTKDGLIDKVVQESFSGTGDETLTLKLNLNKKYNNTEYMCVGVTYNETEDRHRREIQNLVHLVYDPSQNLGDDGASGLVSTSKVPQIGAAVGGVIVTSLLVAVAVTCWRRPQRQQAHEVETYACTTVQYVDLQTTSSTNRNVIRDDAPYAQIIGVLEPKK